METWDLKKYIFKDRSYIGFRKRFGCNSLTFGSARDFDDLYLKINRIFENKFITASRISTPIELGAVISIELIKENDYDYSDISGGRFFVNRLYIKRYKEKTVKDRITDIVDKGLILDLMYIDSWGPTITIIGKLELPNPYINKAIHDQFTNSKYYNRYLNGLRNEVNNMDSNFDGYKIFRLRIDSHYIYTDEDIIVLPGKGNSYNIISCAENFYDEYERYIFKCIRLLDCSYTDTVLRIAENHAGYKCDVFYCNKFYTPLSISNTFGHGGIRIRSIKYKDAGEGYRMVIVECSKKEDISSELKSVAEGSYKGGYTDFIDKFVREHLLECKEDNMNIVQVSDSDTFYYGDKIIALSPKNVTIKDVIFNDNATIVFWDDGTKTVVKMHEDELEFDPEKAIMAAFMKKVLNNFSSVVPARARSLDRIFDKWNDKFNDQFSDK